MMHLFLNGLAATAGAGLAYIRGVVPHLSCQAGIHTTIALTSALRSELGDPANISFIEIQTPHLLRRYWQEQTELPRLIRRRGADILISAGNFSVRNSPVPQILLSGNSLYTSSDFSRDLRQRREHRLWLDTRVRGVFAKRSISWADCTVAPSRAFAEELRRWTGREVTSIYHGFDHSAFFSDESQLPDEIAQKIASDPDALRLVFVSHYNYYRNFETLLRAVPLMQRRLGKRKVKLFLTCRLTAGANPGTYRPETAAALVRSLGIADQVVELGTVPYRQLHNVYRACQIYVTPAYTETFAHPLVEAMASGLPVVASDLAVHKEICGDAGVYFSPFSPEDLAEQVCQVGACPDRAENLAACGRRRSLDFSWKRHVEEMLSVSASLLDSIKK